MQVQLEHSYKVSQLHSNTPLRVSKTSARKLVWPKIGRLLHISRLWKGVLKHIYRPEQLLQENDCTKIKAVSP